VRYLDLGVVPAAHSQAVYHALAELMTAEDPITLVTVSPDRPYVCVGYHQVAEREVDRAYCERHGIPVGRRLVGGGAVLLDGDQVFWHLLLPHYRWPVATLYERLLQAPVRAYQRMGIPAHYRPVNDLVVGPRKIGGTGAATIGATTVLVGSLLFDFDTELMSRVLRVPSEKFRDKMVQSLHDYMTTIRRELGDAAPDRPSAVRWLVEAFAEVLGEPIEPSGLTEAEQRRVALWARKLFAPDFVYRHGGWVRTGVKIREDVYLREGAYKAPGGLVRVIFREANGVIDDAVVAGDFFVDPPDGLDRVAAALSGRPLDRDAVMPELASALAAVTVPGVTAEDIWHAVSEAVGHAREVDAASPLG
jgi:lipoate-protein ligase A